MNAQAHRCPSAEALARASVSSSLDPALAAHLGGCARCAAAMEDIEALRTLVRQIPAEGLPESRVQSVRTALIARADVEASAEASSSAWVARPALWRGVAVSAAVAAALLGVAAVGWWPSAPSVGSSSSEEVRGWRGRVHGHEGARFLKVSGPPDEIVRLIEGRLTIEVEALEGAERFRVVTNDAEVEVRGTVFDVEARGDALVAVRVLQGEVEVRPLGRPVALLKAGQRWSAEVKASAEGRGGAKAEVDAPDEGGGSSASVAGSGDDEARDVQGEEGAGARGVVEVGEGEARGAFEGAAVADRQGAQRPGEARGERQRGVRLQRERAPSLVEGEEVGSRVEPQDEAEALGSRVEGGGLEPSASELDFERGWRALRGGDPAAAAAAFERAAVDADGRLAEDASFWRGVALDRGGDREAARAQMEGFLRVHPGSVRAGSASAMAGWMRLKEGDLAGARAHFERARGDADPKVDASARAGLAEVARREAGR